MFAYVTLVLGLALDLRPIVAAGSDRSLDQAEINKNKSNRLFLKLTDPDVRMHSCCFL